MPDSVAVGRVAGFTTFRAGIVLQEELQKLAVIFIGDKFSVHILGALLASGGSGCSLYARFCFHVMTTFFVVAVVVIEVVVFFENVVRKLVVV